MIFLIILFAIWALAASFAFFLSVKKIFQLMDFHQQTVADLEEIMVVTQSFFNISTTMEYLPEVIAWENLMKTTYKRLKVNLEEAGIPTDFPEDTPDKNQGEKK